jgi:hypothetical protein
MEIDIDYKEAKDFEKSAFVVSLKKFRELETKLKEKEDFIKRTFEDWADDDIKIEQLVEPIIGRKFIDGDSYCVPGTVVCVEKLVKNYNELKLEKDALWVKTQEDEREINDLRDVNKQLREEIEKLKELHTLNFMSDMLPMEKLQKQLNQQNEYIIDQSLIIHKLIEKLVVIPSNPPTPSIDPYFGKREHWVPCKVTDDDLRSLNFIEPELYKPLDTSS